MEWRGLVVARSRGRARDREPSRRSGTAPSTARTCSAPRRSRSTGRTRPPTSTSRRTSTRVLELPGADFASYRWGNTVDPITPGIMDRPYVARELIPYGSPASANLLNALDLRIQDRQLPPDAIAPIVRLMGVGDDRASATTSSSSATGCCGRSSSRSCSRRRRSVSGRRRRSARRARAARSCTRSRTSRRSVARRPLGHAAAGRGLRGEGPDCRSCGPRPTQGSVVIAGDGDGVVDAARRRICSATTRSCSTRRRSPRTRPRCAPQLGAGATLVVTDSNRDRARRWSTVTDTVGLHRGPGEPSAREGPGRRAARHVPRRRRRTRTRRPGCDGVKGVARERLRQPDHLHARGPRRRAPSTAIRSTAWRTGAFDDVRGDRIRIVARPPDHHRPRQPRAGR